MIDGALARKMLAEFIGTFFLIFAGTGSIIVNAERGSVVGHIGIGITFGLTIMVMIFAVGHISGAHFNPAVTIAFAATGHFPFSSVPFYITGQLAGALMGSLLLRGMFGNVAGLGATLPAGNASQALILEVVLTFFLMFVIISVATDARAVQPAAAIAIGGTVGLEAIFAGPISGASMNPARSLAPALVSGTWASQWIYIIGPIAGALAGAFVYSGLRRPAMEEAST